MRVAVLHALAFLARAPSRRRNQPLAIGDVPGERGPAAQIALLELCPCRVLRNQKLTTSAAANGLYGAPDDGWVITDYLSERP